MIKSISFNNVASYKNNTILETDKKINLIYGLNGVGKSTFSNYLYQPKDYKYKECTVQGIDESYEILVYNQNFIQENFFEAQNLRGIFTLSKKNKDAETKIDNAIKEIKKLEDEGGKISEEINAEIISINKKLNFAKDHVWKIKTSYSGGDRVFEFCLKNLMGSKDTLFNHINGLGKNDIKPEKSIDDLKIELQSISGSNDQKYSALPQIILSSQSIESEILFEKQIVGNESSSVSQLIKELGNSDWVKAGLQYIPSKEKQANSDCPFCQEKTISNALIENIKKYFDDSYEADISTLKIFLSEYSQAIDNIPNKYFFEANPKFEAYKNYFEIQYMDFKKIVEDNKKLIEDKIKTPSVSLTLKQSKKVLENINEIIKKINLLVSEHNENIEQKESFIQSIKHSFWEVMRWDYDQTICSINSDKTTSDIKIKDFKDSLKLINDQIKIQKDIIAEKQKQTVNIDEAINNIKISLEDLGITDFEIKKHEDNLYKVVRGEKEDQVFHSLSEGEKMIISFLYFIELCRGKINVTESGRKKIIVIDDPISSLSHIYVFNIGRLIKNEFFGRKKTKIDDVTEEKTVVWDFNYEQVFILTHSLYFFYEITETNREYRSDTQNLFRLSKNDSGSTFTSMKYEEIQNDYQAYWSIIKDEQQPAALIANCMRNVIEYFFNFVEKKDLNNFFQNRSLQSNRFQAFYRYINRESHSLGQNIFDFKEFNYQDFKEAFAELFKVAGYEAHYKKMIKV